MEDSNNQKPKERNIKSDVRTFKELFSFRGKRYAYCVPAFQRNYCWDEKNWFELFRYFELALESERDIFLGILIFADKKQKSDQNHELILIDGQQRITTLSLFMLVFLKLKKEHSFSYSSYNEKEIKEIIFQNPKNQNFKNLNLNFFPEEDSETYSRLVDFFYFENIKEIQKKPKSGIEKAFFAIEEFLRKQLVPTQVNDLFNILLNRTFFTTIIVEQDNIHSQSTSQPEHMLKIFETINSTGKELNLLDKIKNYLLFNFAYDSKENQREYVDDFWKEWSDKFNIFKKNNLELFFTVLCSIVFRSLKDNDIKTGYKLERKDLYSIFRFYYQEFELKKITTEMIKKDFSFLTKLINRFYLILYSKLYYKNSKLDNKRQKFIKNLDNLDKLIINENKKNYLNVFDQEFLLFSFFFSILRKPMSFDKHETYFLNHNVYSKLMRLFSTFQLILIIWLEKKPGSMSWLNKYNNILHKVLKKNLSEDDNKDIWFYNFHTRIDCPFKNSFNAFDIEGFYNAFVKEFDLKLIIEEIQEYSTSTFISFWKKRFFERGRTHKNEFLYKSILQFNMNEKILCFEKSYDFEHIAPKKSNKLDFQEIHNIGNIIPLEEFINKKAKDKTPNDKIKNYIEGKSKNPEMQSMLEENQFQDWDDEKIKKREENILKIFLKTLKEGLNIKELNLLSKK